MCGAHKASYNGLREIEGYYFEILRRKKLTIDKTILKSKADQKPSTWNPGTNVATKYTIKAFMTKVNRPKVSNVAGRVRMKSIGFRKVFTSPNTTDTMIAVRKLSTVTPDNRYAAIYTARPFTIRFMMIPITHMVKHQESEVKGSWKSMN